MRSRDEIYNSTREYDQLSLEVLLDIRELLQKMLKKPIKATAKKRVNERTRSKRPT